MPQAKEARTILGWAAVRGTRRWSREQGEWVVAEWRGSGQSVQSFATEHGIDPQRVYFWSKRSRPQHKGKRGNQRRPEIVELKLGSSATAVIALVTKLRDMNTELTKQLANQRRVRPRSERARTRSSASTAVCHGGE